MDITSFNPLDDIKKLGEILMKRTSEKEYFRFLQIQEQCRLKWQSTNDKFIHLWNEHKKCILEKQRLAIKLEHIIDLWEREKEYRRSMERECNHYKMKLNRTCELLRCDQDLIDKNEERILNGKSGDEISSTGSFLSGLSNITHTDDDIDELNGTVGSRRLATQFDKLFVDVENNGTDENDSLEDIDEKSANKHFLEKTFRFDSANKRNEISDESVNYDDTQAFHYNGLGQSPSKCVKIYGNVSENFEHEILLNENINANGEQCEESIEEMSSGEVDPNPIYERIDSSVISFDFDEKGNMRKVVHPIAMENISPYANIFEQQTNLITNQNNCQHTFAHRTASRSILCFVCSKKFRFGMAYKCRSCCIFVHHDCKSQLKATTKSQQMSKCSGKHMNQFLTDYSPKDGLSIPALIIYCIDVIETRGLSERGCYRVSGSEKEIKALLDRFLCNDRLPDLSSIDIHVICGCIKMFLKSLNEPLIPTSRWKVFANIVMNFDSDIYDGNIQSHLQYEIGQLPKSNRDTLAYLILHLQKVATCSAVQMPISNLARIFAPTVVGYSKHEPDHDSILGETIIQTKVMQYFLDISTDYWFGLIRDDLMLSTNPQNISY